MPATLESLMRSFGLRYIPSELKAKAYSVSRRTVRPTRCLSLLLISQSFFRFAYSSGTLVYNLPR